MLKRHIFALTLGGMAAFATAQADEFLDDRFYVAPFATYLHGGGDRHGFDGWGGGLGFGKILNENFNVEVRGFWQEYKGMPWGGGTFAPYRDFGRYNADLTGGTIDVQYYFFRDAFSPYVVAGIGGMNTSLRYPGVNAAQAAVLGVTPAQRLYASNLIAASGKSGSNASFIFETGLGATYELADNFLLRADVRYRLDTAASDYTRNADVFHDLVVNAGFVIPFGDKPQPTHVAPAPKVADCSGRDSDHDGVSDCDDKCPNTAKGIKIDEFGCPIRIELKGVNFKYDSAELTDVAKSILDKVSGDLMAYPVKKNIEVRGHTSTEGSNAYNLALSQRRSQSVANYLKSKGVTNKLIAKGYGEDYPLVSPDSSEAQREKNRRVELVWTGE